MHTESFDDYHIFIIYSDLYDFSTLIWHRLVRSFFKEEMLHLHIQNDMAMQAALF